ncbi:MAG: hypothetical protein OXB88_09015 [Bacteriovoracales bacterium]|nr:hypothetical protein [Bacteriovoracales bacterium]
MDFYESQKSKIIELSGRSQRYLGSIESQIKSNNGILFGNFKEKGFLIINDKKPYHFSIPDGKTFISLGLLKKYVKSEGLLVSVLTLEMIRAHKKIFTKNIIVPTGVVSFEDLRPLLKVNLNFKNDVNKWAIYSLKRSGFSPLSLLRLLQLKNKNFLDFFDTQDESEESSIEEAQLKSFLIKSGLFSDINKFQKNSSRGFYHFINEIKRL